MVMYGGRVMEYGTANDIFYQPSHPYTVGLLGALPRLDHDGAELMSIPGNPPNMANMPKGCPFAERCEHASQQCVDTLPQLVASPLNSRVQRACHKPAAEMIVNSNAEVANG
jgi:oligopeptide transport system ATP-binding protein